MKTVNGCKDVSIMFLQDKQWWRTSNSVCISCFTKNNRMQSKHSRRKSYGLNQRIVYKDEIEFVTEFPCLLGHPVKYKFRNWIKNDILYSIDDWRWPIFLFFSMQVSFTILLDGYNRSTSSNPFLSTNIDFKVNIIYDY